MLVGAGCHKAPGPVAAGGIAAPLSADSLTAGHFVAYTLLWQVAVPGGDPIVFRADGTVENTRAGLAGSWRIADDSTLLIRSPDRFAPGAPPRVFRLRGSHGDLASPVPTPDRPGGPVFWIQRQGSPAPRD
jgi:hypothetical protein